MKSITYLLKRQEGTTFIELLMYIAVFLVLIPVLLAVSVNSIRFDKQHQSEKQSNADSQFAVERIYDLIASAKKVDVANSDFNSPGGVLTLVMADDSVVSIQGNLTEKSIDITEGGVTDSLTSDDLELESLYFERISDNMNDPEIILGVAARLRVTGTQEGEIVQEYITSSNLEAGDFDGDGCPDYQDRFPRHPQCCGDSDEDGICNELDNCVLAYNPFQEDYEGDGIGDECDGTLFFAGPGSEPELPAGGDYDTDLVANELDNCPTVENPDQTDTDGDGIGDACDLDLDEGGGAGGTGGGLTAFNCTQDGGELDLIALINQEPPMPPGPLKNVLVSSSPLSPAVLQAIINRDPQLPEGNLQQIFSLNAKLIDYAPNNIYENVMNMDIAGGVKNVIEAAQNAATTYGWQGNNEVSQVSYQVEVNQEEGWVNFHTPDYPLGEGENQRTDLFMIDATGTAGSVAVTVEAGGLETQALANEGDSTNLFGFQVTLMSISGQSHAFTVTSAGNTSSLSAIKFDFGVGASVVSPTPPTHASPRFTYYCPGGCSENCGDGGTGVIVGDIFADSCYQAANGDLPEWCSRWKTFMDNDTTTPAYLGGTQEGEEDLYWEKSFKSILSEGQIDELESVTIGGEVAYQSITQFFCDSLGASCPINGNLNGSQALELYNWETAAWEGIGALNLDGTSSDQQAFEVKYDGANPQKFLGGLENRIIRSRMQFNWDGVLQPGQTSAPAFMLIDYFTAHLKW